jgi:hypothetical protein
MKLELKIASTLILSFETHRDHLPRFLFFTRHLCISKWGVPLQREDGGND